MSLLGVLAGCASQVPTGVYQDQCPDNRCTMRLYIGHEQVPCALVVRMGEKKGLLRACELTSLGEDNYSMLLISQTREGDITISRDRPQLHYDHAQRSVLLHLKAKKPENDQNIHLRFIPGRDNGSFNPPWPKLAAEEADDDTPELGMSDAELSKAQVGSWVIAPKDADYSKHVFISVYHANGQVDGYAYADVACQKPTQTVHGNWKIEAGQLKLTISGSSDPQAYPVGATTTDTIMQVGKDKQVLKASDGTYLYRFKRDSCIVPKS